MNMFNLHVFSPTSSTFDAWCILVFWSLSESSKFDSAGVLVSTIFSFRQIRLKNHLQCVKVHDIYSNLHSWCEITELRPEWLTARRVAFGWGNHMGYDEFMDILVRKCEKPWLGKIKGCSFYVFFTTHGGTNWCCRLRSSLEVQCKVPFLGPVPIMSGASEMTDEWTHQNGMSSFSSQMGWSVMLAKTCKNIQKPFKKTLKRCQHNWKIS